MEQIDSGPTYDAVYGGQSRVTAPEHDAHSGIGPTQIIVILKHYWKISLAIVIGVSVVGMIAIKLLPKTYTATATLLVNSVNKDPLAGEDVPLGLLGNFAATQIDLLGDPTVLLPVVDRLRLATDPDFGGKPSNDANGQRDVAAKALSGSLLVNQGRGGQVINITAAARTGPKAALIANTVVDVYIEQQRQRLFGPAAERAQRYTIQLAELRAKVAAAQEKVSRFRSERRLEVPSAATNSDLELGALQVLKGKLLDAESARRLLETESSQNIAGNGGDTTRINALKTTLSALREEEQTLGPQHPRLVEVQRQMAEAQRSLNAEFQSINDKGRARLQDARQLEAQLRRAVGEQSGAVTRVGQAQDQSAKFVLELESSQAVYKRALEGFDQIMFASASDHAHVDVISRAMAPAKPSRPNKMKLALLCVVAACGLGAVLPLLYEFLFNRRVRCREDLERAFGLDVLAEFDSITVS